MPRFIVLAFGYLLVAPLLRAAEAVPVAVTITKRTAIEALSADGSVAGVNEATIDTHMTLISADATQVILQDSQGIHYRIAINSTDYVPSPTTALTATNAVTQTPLPVVTTPAPVVSPVSPAPSGAANPPAVATSDQPAPLPDSPVFTVKLGDRQTTNAMSVWPAGGIADRPLLIAAHGNGGSGPGEINGWLSLARSHQFTIVCPSFLSSVNSSHLAEDEPYFKVCIQWIKDNLKYDGDNVFMVGFSGGGFATWYLATKRPDFFRGLAFQSGNFGGNYYDLDLSRWFNRPIKLIWGSQDLPDIPIENGNAVDALKFERCKNYTTEIVPDGHHQEHQDLVVAWMEQNLAKPDDSSSP